MAQIDVGRADAAVGITGTTETVSYLYSDHLMTTRLASDQRQAIIWRWQGEAFGNTPAIELATIRINLRFPGQYYDSETNLHYNHHRYYDPQLGRYITSDPIGLAGGLNTYAYANSNPIMYIDPLGLYGTNSCAYYKKRCQEEGGLYYCHIAPAVCTNWPDDPWGWGDCVRKCLQEFDEYCYDDSCEKNGSAVICVINIHQMCWLECGNSGPPSSYPRPR